MTDPDFHVDTPRLHLTYFQPSRPDHCDFLVKLWNTPEFIATSGETSVKTREDAYKQIDGRFRKQHAQNGYGVYLVVLKNTDAPATEPFSKTLERCKKIGTVSLLRGDDSDAFTAPDLGFAMLPEEMRKGYAREAAQSLLDYSEKELGVKDVLGLHDPTNKGSAGVFRSLGFDNRGLRILKPFGGVEGMVWTKKGMKEDLNHYNF